MFLKLSKRCALCGEGGDLSFCHRCLVGLHFECYVELGGSRCPTIGCSDKKPPPASGQRHLSYQEERHLANLMRDYEERTGDPPTGDALHDLILRAERMEDQSKKRRADEDD